MSTFLLSYFSTSPLKCFVVSKKSCIFASVIYQ